MALRRIAELAGAVLAIIGGSLILLSGFTVHSFLLSIISLLSDRLITILPGSVAIPLSIALTILSILVALGGITIILGGITIIRHHLSLGRLLIALGGGASFLAFLVAIVYALVTGGVTSISAHSEYWVGVILSVFARWLTGRHKSKLKLSVAAKRTFRA